MLIDVFSLGKLTQRQQNLNRIFQFMRGQVVSLKKSGKKCLGKKEDVPK